MTNEMKFYNGIDLQSQKGVNFADPSAGSDAATKQYVDNLIDGKAYKQEVRAATTTNGTLATAFANGQTVDGVVLATGDRILLKNQTIGSENGIYVVASSGAPSRSSDMDTSAETRAATVVVMEGTVNADTQWTQTADNVTLSTTPLVWAQSSAGAPYTASLGVQKVGNDFRANVDGTTLQLTGNVLHADRVALGATAKYAASVGSMTGGTPVTITHGLTTTDVEVYTTLVSSGEQVNLSPKVVDANNITLVSASAQSSGTFRVVVVG